jgi:hypothetical protein
VTLQTIASPWKKIFSFSAVHCPDALLRAFFPFPAIFPLLAEEKKGQSLGPPPLPLRVAGAETGEAAMPGEA